MRVIRGSRNAQRSIITRVSSLDPPSMQICSTPNVVCCRATEASVRSIVAAAFKLTVTIESRRSMGIPILHETSGNALVERKDVIGGTLVRVPSAYPAYFGIYRQF